MGTERSARLMAIALLPVLLLLGFAWALASHPGSSPDDNFHLASTWCAWGAEAAGCNETDRVGRTAFVNVPELSDAISECTKFRPTESADCISEDDASDPPYPATANGGSYPPGYYAVARLFVGPDTERSLLIMRGVAFVVSSILLISAGLLLRGSERWRTWWFLLIVSVPTAFFYFASNNPSGTTIAGCVAAAAGAYCAGRDTGWRHSASALAVGIAGALVAGLSRPDGWQFALMAVGLGALSSVQSVRHSLRWNYLVPWAILAATPIVIFLASGKSATSDYSLSAQPGTDVASVGRLSIILEIPRLYVGEFATNLGWLDTPMPALVWGLAAIALGAVIVLGVGDLTVFRGLALGLAGVLVFAVPLYMLLVVDKPVGEWVQPRYLLPLVLSSAAVLAFRPGATSRLHGSRIVVLSLIALIAHTWALHRVIRRSVTGIDDASLGLTNGAEWWWQIPFSPMTVWIVGSLSYALVLGGVGWFLWRAEGASGVTPQPVTEGIPHDPEGDGDADEMRAVANESHRAPK